MKSNKKMKLLVIKKALIFVACSILLITGVYAQNGDVIKTNDQVLFPNTVKAYRIDDESQITIIAEGYELDYCNIRIEEAPIPIFPAVYEVVGEHCEAIGYFPYRATATFPYPTDVDYIQFRMANGTQRIRIVDVWEEFKPKALVEIGNKEVVGYAYNSTDINEAIADAVSKLQRRSSDGGVSAVVKKSGFVAAGSPIGIAFFYVVMEQQDD